MKNLFFAFAFLLVYLPQHAMAQNPDQDPLAESKTIRKGGHELIGIRPVLRSGTAYDLSIEVSRYFHENNNLVRVLEYKGPAVGRNFDAYSITTLDSRGEGISDIVAAWTLAGKVELVSLRADANHLGFANIDSSGAYKYYAQWEDTTTRSITTPAPYDGGNWLRTPPLLKAGDFNGDGKEQILLAYLANHQGNIIINLSLLDADNLFERAFSRVQQMQPDQHTSMRPAHRPLGIFDVATGDFNGNGRDEILLVGRQSDGSGGWDLFASLYEWRGTNTLTRVLHEVFYTKPQTDPGFYFEIQDIRVSAGRFYDSQSHQAVISFTLYNSHDIYASYMTALAFDDAFTQMFTTGEPFRRARTNQTGLGAYWDNVVRTGDITGNGLDEIVSNAGYHTSKSYNIYRLNSDLQFIEYAENLGVPQQTSPVFTLGSLNMGQKDQNTHSDLATANQALYTINIHDNGTYTGVTPAINPGFAQYGCWFAGGNHQYDCSSPLISAELDGDIRIGTPRRYRISNITQPLVILKAPPTHFDILDGVTYDISDSYYPYSSSNFSVRYTEVASQQQAISTEFTRDWGVSATLSAGGSFLGAGVSAHLSAEYGQRFTKKGTQKRTVTVGTSVAASLDDRIYATTMSYDIWEYPVISFGIERGHILVVDPAVTNHTWLPGRSGSADSYITGHEAGNILSYREFPPGNHEIGNEDMFTGPEFMLDENSGDTQWWLNIEKFTETQTTKEKHFNLDVGASVKKWGVKLEIGGSYGTNDISTQTTTVTDALEIVINLGALRTGLGDVSYKVQPFVYWTNDGTLVVDYAVQPSLQGVTTTFWSTRYGQKPDPGFILPWRYYKEKIGDTQDHERRHQTRDISFYPENPKAGEIVTITARVHNFSLVPINERVGVRFYLGDPYNGGTPITGLGDITTLYTDGGIGSRRSKSVEMQWAVPNHVIGTRPRIYGLIHTDDSVPEIHINNNVGWSVLGKETFATGIDDDNDRDKPIGFALHQNYPNPFNPSTTFEFSIPVPGMVTLEVYTILGQRIATLVSGNLAAGNHRHFWDARGITSGVYIYRLQAGEYVESRKLLFLK